MKQILCAKDFTARVRACVHMYVYRQEFSHDPLEGEHVCINGYARRCQHVYNYYTCVQSGASFTNPME